MKYTLFRRLGAIPPPSSIVLVLGPLVYLLLMTGCTLLHSAYIVNATDTPVFANLSHDWEGVRYEDEGALIRPQSGVELQHTGKRLLRVRDLAGDTVFLEEVGAEDTRHAVTGFTPITDAPVPGRPSISLARDGPSDSRRIVCLDGDRKELPLFHVTVTVFNRSSNALVASFIEDYQEVEESEPRGELVTAGDNAPLSGYIVNAGWLRAFDQEGRIAFTQELGRREYPEVTIPTQLPAEPEPIPVFEASSDCVYTNIVFGLIIGLGIAAAVGAGLYWQKRRRKKTAPLPSR